MWQLGHQVQQRPAVLVARVGVGARRQAALDGGQARQVSALGSGLHSIEQGLLLTQSGLGCVGR